MINKSHSLMQFWCAIFLQTAIL